MHDVSITSAWRDHVVTGPAHCHYLRTMLAYGSLWAAHSHATASDLCSVNFSEKFTSFRRYSKKQKYVPPWGMLCVWCTRFLEAQPVRMQHGKMCMGFGGPWTFETYIVTSEPSARAWLFSMMDVLSRDELTKMTVTLWAIWYARRKLIHEGIN